MKVCAADAECEWKAVLIESHVDRTASMLIPTPRGEPAPAEGECKLTLCELFESEETPLLRYAFSLTGRRAVAEEIVQEVFLQLHAHFDEIETPKAWLMRTVRNRALSFVRDHRREVFCVDETQSSSSQDESPEALLMRMEATGLLRQLLQRLDESDRRVVELKYFQGKTYSEISVATGLSISNVGYRLHHILKELGRSLLPLGIDGKP